MTIDINIQEGSEQQRQGGLLHRHLPLRGDAGPPGQRTHSPWSWQRSPLLLHPSVGETRQSAGDIITITIITIITTI